MELVYDFHANLEEMTTEKLSGSVSQDYSHFAKVVFPGEQITIGHTRLKWYSIARAEDGVPSEVECQAREFLENIADKVKADFGDWVS